MGENLEALAKAIYARHPYRNLRGDIISWDRIAQSTHEDANGYEIHDLDVPFYVGTIRALLDFLGFDPQNPPAEGIGAELRARAEAAERERDALREAIGLLQRMDELLDAFRPHLYLHSRLWTPGALLTTIQSAVAAVFLQLESVGLVMDAPRTKEWARRVLSQADTRADALEDALKAANKDADDLAAVLRPHIRGHLHPIDEWCLDCRALAAHEARRKEAEDE